MTKQKVKQVWESPGLALGQALGPPRLSKEHDRPSPGSSAHLLLLQPNLPLAATPSPWTHTLQTSWPCFSVVACLPATLAQGPYQNEGSFCQGLQDCSVPPASARPKGEGASGVSSSEPSINPWVSRGRAGCAGNGLSSPVSTTSFNPSLCSIHEVSECNPLMSPSPGHLVLLRVFSSNTEQLC